MFVHTVEDAPSPRVFDMTFPVSRTLYLRPGNLCVPGEPARLCAVVASGVAVTIFDRERRMGGMGHYSHPKRRNGASTPVFAAPALVELVRMFKNLGSRPAELETYLYGGSDNPFVPDFDPRRSALNVRFGLEILERLGVRVSGSDVGGRFARKVVFCTATGQSITAKVLEVRSNDWYPDLPAGVPP
ncbi:MAG: chemotaxis protein CheD [Planctomycetota bacterium]|nr:chemotaxis protein CheD [Planctomycetota bacterium]